MSTHVFGGDWTEEKLEVVRKYLSAYTTIFAENKRARYFTTTYVDGFAGSGTRTVTEADPPRDGGARQLFDERDEELAVFKKGSARIALEVEPPFDRFIFVENNAARALELEKLRELFPAKAASIDIGRDDANAFVQRWCSNTDWRRNRAVVFLDPYGMQVRWATIEAIARTRAIDFWLLFPLGVAVNRMLPRDGRMSPEWEASLTEFLGTDDWKQTFYRLDPQAQLFPDGGPSTTRSLDCDAIGRYFVERLKTVFAAVAERPLELVNSRGTMLYWLCFAAGNDKGAQTALRIARDVIRSMQSPKHGRTLDN